MHKITARSFHAGRIGLSYGCFQYYFSCRLKLDDNSTGELLVHEVANEHSVPSIQAVLVNGQHLLEFSIHRKFYKNSNGWQMECCLCLLVVQKDRPLMNIFEVVKNVYFCTTWVGLSLTNSLFSDISRTKLMFAIRKIQGKVFALLKQKQWILSRILKSHIFSQKQIRLYANGTFSRL